MSSVPPISSNSSLGFSTPQKNQSSGTPNGTKNTSDKNTSAKNIYPYNFPNMVKEQRGKVTGAVQRMVLTLSPGGGKQSFYFGAHIDPQHLTDEQNKRIIQQDVLTGVVFQDFGYMAENIELKGTTGSEYFLEIQEMDDIFNNQSLQGTPTQVELTIEGRTYDAIWKSFTYNRINTAQGGNIYEYEMAFTVLQRTTSASQVIASVTVNSGVAQQNAVNNTSQVYNNVFVNGQTAQEYIRSITSIPVPMQGLALTFIASHWDTTLNNGDNYPGATVPLTNYITTPLDWGTYLATATNTGAVT